MIRSLSVCLLLLTALGAGSGASAKNSVDSRAWKFNVLLDGKPIGHHHFELTRDGDRQVVSSEASFNVKFLFVTAFRYRHRTTEVWDGDCLSSIDAETDSNGTKLKVRGAAGESGFELSSAGDAEKLPNCVKTFAYWNPSVLRAPRLLNSQTGDYESVTLQFEQTEEIAVAGEAVEARRYRLTAPAGDLRLWYSSWHRVWIGLEAPARGGRTIRYEPVAVPEPADVALTHRPKTTLAQRPPSR